MSRDQILCPLNVGVACIMISSKGEVPVMKQGVATQLNYYLFQTIPAKSLEFYLPKEAESCWQLGRAGLGVLGRNVMKGAWKLVLPLSGNCDFSFLVGLKFHLHRKRKTFVIFFGTFWLQSLCCFALLRKQRSYIVSSKNPSEYTEDVRDSQWKSGTEKALDHDHSYVMLYPNFAFKMPE